MSDTTWTFNIAGVQFRDIEEQIRASNLKEDERLILVPEPTNQYDPNAVQIHTEDGKFLGFVPKRIALKWAEAGQPIDSLSACWSEETVCVRQNAELRS